MDQTFGTAFASSLFEWSYTVVVITLLWLFLVRSFSLPHASKKLVTHWILFGFIINFFGLSWLYSVYPLSWLQGGAVQLLGIGLLHLILSATTSIPYTLVALTHHPKVKKVFFPLVFASSLTLAEVARALIISTLYYGKDTTVALHFTAGTIGNALSTTPLIEFAYFGGTFALTFVLSYLIYCFSTVKNMTQYARHIIVILLLLPCIHFFLPITKPRIGTTVGIVTTNFSTPTTDNEKIYREAFERQSLALHQATLSFSTTSTIIVYPEDTRYLSHLHEKERGELVERFPSTLFVDGDLITTKKGFSNVSLFYSPKNRLQGARGKELLLPFNEYIPFFFAPLFRFFVGKESLDAYTKLHTFTPIYSKKTVVFDGERVGTLICSEILSYSTIEKLRDEHPAIVLFQSRLNVFHNRPWFIMHLRSFSKIAAAQLRTPLISSTSGAPSFIISPYGTVEYVLPVGFGTSTYIVTH